MKTAKFAVIGVGVWGSRHIETYQDHPLAEVAAICDANPETLQDAGDKYGVKKRYSDYREMLGAGGIDAVSIVTPDFAHAEIAVAAIEAGVSILIEKPLATTLEDCDRIGEALKKNPVKFMVDFHNRWNPATERFKSRIEKGQIGEVQMFYYRLSDKLWVPTDMLSWAGRSTVNWFLGSHCLDTLMYLFNDTVSEVYTVRSSRVLKRLGIDTPDFYQSVLHFKKGAKGVLENCWILSNSSPSLIDIKFEVVGEKGTLYFDGRPQLVESYTEQEAECPDILVCPTVFGKPVGFAIESIRHFADCVCADRDPASGFEDGREVTKVLLAMEESASAGRPVAVE